MSYLDELKHVAGMAITDLGTLALANAKEFPEASKELARIAMNLSRVVDRRPTPEPQGEVVAWGVKDRNGELWVCDFGLATITKADADGFAGWAPTRWPEGAPFSVVPLYTRPQPGEGGGEVYRSLLAASLAARRNGWEATEDRILDVMDTVWSQMTEAEQTDARVHTAALSKGGQGG